MKKFYRFIGLVGFILMIAILPTAVYGQSAKKNEIVVSSNNSIFEENPVNVLDSFYSQANKNSSDRVQNTDLDNVTSKYCTEAIANRPGFTITKTLCNIKSSIGNYLQYIMYIGLAAATILLIWNGFKLVTSSDKAKQMGTFKKNLIYIIIGVILLVSFYYIIDVFVSVVNLVAE